VGLNHRLLAALKQSSQKLSFSRSMAYGIWGIRCSSMCHNFRNGNRFQELERKPREVAEFDGDEMVGARGFEPPTPWSRTRK
jgi:hypothetical protein